MMAGPVYLFENAAFRNQSHQGDYHVPPLASIMHRGYPTSYFRPSDVHPANVRLYHLPPMAGSRQFNANSLGSAAFTTPDGRPSQNQGYSSSSNERPRQIRITPLDSETREDSEGLPAAILTDKDADSPDPNTASTRNSVSAPSVSSCPESAIRKLREGETLYWHHLKRTGEMPAIVDDPRARSSCQIAGIEGRVVRERVFAGR